MRQCLTGAGGHDAVGGPFEKLAACFLLDLGDGAMHRRLGKAKLPRGKGEILCFAHGDQRLKLRVTDREAQSRRDIGQRRIETLESAPETRRQNLAARGEEKAVARPLEDRAAHLALGLASDERACRATVLSSIPDVVRTRVSRAALLAAHQAAWRETRMSNDDPRRTLLSVLDPLRRALLSLSLPGVSSVIRGEALCTALADMPTAESTMFAWTVLPALLGMNLVPATAVETVASLVSSIAYGGAEVRGFGPHRE